jgi:hypothetical protein
MSNNLSECWECGKPISKSAYGCPNCGCPRPFGVVCGFCGKLARVSELVGCTRYDKEIERQPPPMFNTLNSQYVLPLHENCYRLIFPSFIPDDLSCPDCHGIIRLNDAAKRSENYDPYWLPCPRCGLPDPLHSLGYCGHCGLLIIPGFHHFHERPRRNVYSAPIRYHTACAQQSGLRNGGCASVALAFVLVILVPITAGILSTHYTLLADSLFIG